MEAPGPLAGFAQVRMAGVLLLAVSITGCSSSVTANSAAETQQPEAVTATESALDDIPIPLSLYILTDADAPSSALSSRRSTDEVNDIAAAIQTIWQPAGISFGPVHVENVAVPAEVLEAIALSGDPNSFFDQVGRTFDIPEPGLVNGFYVASAAGVNGFTPTGSRIFFVVDEPSVHDERVSSHEIGHILGLHHETEDVDRLMFSGTNGMTVTEQEVGVVRYGAQGMLDGVR